LEVSATGDLLLFCRKSNGLSTTYHRMAKVKFPVEIKLIRQGDVFYGLYREHGEWKKGTSVISDVGTDQYIGFYVCSGDDSQIGYAIESGRENSVTFSDWLIDYEENYIPAETDFADNEMIKPGTLLRDNFNDGSMHDGPETIINPIWKGIKYAQLPADGDGGRYWRKTGDGIYYLGNEKWTDYEINIELAFDEDGMPENEFMLQFRKQNISVYDEILRCYSVGFRNGNKLFFQKHKSGGVSKEEKMIPCYLDGKKHVLNVRLVDCDYSVFYDDRLIFEGKDMKHPITYGNIALKFSNVAMNIHYIEILKTEDTVNGDADNFLLDYYDTPIPPFLKKYGYK
jgi:hypothetical protein